MVKDLERAQLEWRCRRGMLELDLLLGRFMQEAYAALNQEQKTVFKRLLEQADPDLYSWLMGYAQSEDHELQDFVDWYRQHYSNVHRT